MGVRDTARINMIENQLRPSKVTDERVIGAFARLRRELFVPEPLRGVAYLEDDEQLARLGRAALVDHRIGSVVYVDGPLNTGHRQRAPDDLILFAGAVAEIPSEIAAQLAEAGRMAAVLRAAQGVGRATLTTRTGGVLAHRVIFDAATPLLPGFVPKPAFVF